MGLSRSGWMLAILSTLSVGLVAPDAHSTALAVSGPDFPQALIALASLVQLAIACWVLLVICLARLGGTSRIAGALTPDLLRRALFAGAVGALALTPAQADRGTSPAHTTQHSLDGLPLPDRPMAMPMAIPPADRFVVVKPGDTLWAIAARSLPAGVGDTQITEACARWYAVNRSVIGDDPDLIHPSQHLTPPTKDDS